MQLGVRNLSAVVTNLHERSDRQKEAIKGAVRRGGQNTHDVAFAQCPVDTGFMQDHLQLEFTPEGYGFEVGWKDEDFTGAGLDFYPPFVVLGTRFQAPQDPLTPAYNQTVPQLLDDLRDAMRGAAQ